MDPVDDDRVVSLPLDEHTPLTVAEAGLELDPVGRRWRRIVALAAGAVVVVVGLLALVARDGSAPGLAELDAGTCFEPVATDVSAGVEVVPCGPGTAAVVRKVPSPGSADAPHPGDGALTLLGQGACQGEVDADRLVVAIPSPAAWADGERTVVCSQRR